MLNPMRPDKFGRTSRPRATEIFTRRPQTRAAISIRVLCASPWRASPRAAQAADRRVWLNTLAHMVDDHTVYALWVGTPVQLKLPTAPSNIRRPAEGLKQRQLIAL